MIELLGSYLVVFDSGFDVLRYLTVRTIGGTITALFLSIFLGPRKIDKNNAVIVPPIVRTVR